MDKLKHILKEHLGICGIIALALIVKLALYTSYPPFWDAASYILMGKYLFSSGAVGLIEPFRPPVWPLVLGFFWKIGLNPIVAGKVLEILLGLGNILLVYLIGKKVYDRNVGLLASLFVALSPTFFIWGNSLYTDVPGSSLGLFTVYLFFQKRFLLAGLLGGFTFFTRFTQIIPFIVLLATHIFYRPSKQSLIQILKSLLGFGSVTLVFLFLNQTVYGDWLYPFQEAREVYLQAYTSWTILKCLKFLIVEENWALPLIFLSFINLPTGNNRPFRWAIAGAGLISLASIGKIDNDYHRLSITSLPYLYLLLAESVNNIKQRSDRTTLSRAGFLLTAGLIIIFAVQFNKITDMHFPKNELNLFQKYVRDHHTEIKGNLWISSPKMLVFSDLKPAEQMYHPIFSHRKIQQLRLKLSTADTILFNSYDLPCVPKDDIQCQEEKIQLIDEIKQKFKSEFYEEGKNGQYVLGIFKKR